MSRGIGDVYAAVSGHRGFGGERHAAPRIQGNSAFEISQRVLDAAGAQRTAKIATSQHRRYFTRPFGAYVHGCSYPGETARRSELLREILTRAESRDGGERDDVPLRGLSSPLPASIIPLDAREVRLALQRIDILSSYLLMAVRCVGGCCGRCPALGRRAGRLAAPKPEWASHFSASARARCRWGRADGIPTSHPAVKFRILIPHEHRAAQVAAAG